MDRFKFGLSIPWAGTDFNQVLDVIDELGLEYVDLRTIGDRNITEVSDATVQEVENLIKKHDVKVSSVSPFLFFRLPLTDKEDEMTFRGSFPEHLEMLKRAIEIAKRFGTNYIRSFHFNSEFLFSTAGYRDLPFDVWSKLIERLQKAARIAEEAGVTLLLENCHWCNLGTGCLAAKAIDDIGSKNVRLWWDPGNTATATGLNPYPYEYERIKDYIEFIDMKDQIVNRYYYTQEYVGMGEGNNVNWPDIFRALIRDNYQKMIVYESLYIPQGGTMYDGIRQTFARARAMVASVE